MIVPFLNILSLHELWVGVVLVNEVSNSLHLIELSWERFSFDHLEMWLTSSTSSSTLSSDFTIYDGQNNRF